MEEVKYDCAVYHSEYIPPCVSGQQFIGWFKILDFGQYLVKWLGRDFAVETETAHISVETKESGIWHWNQDSSGSQGLCQNWTWSCQVLTMTKYMLSVGYNGNGLDLMG